MSKQTSNSKFDSSVDSNSGPDQGPHANQDSNSTNVFPLYRFHQHHEMNVKSSWIMLNSIMHMYIVWLPLQNTSGSKQSLRHSKLLSALVKTTSVHLNIQVNARQSLHAQSRSVQCRWDCVFYIESAEALCSQDASWPLNTLEIMVIEMLARVYVLYTLSSFINLHSGLHSGVEQCICVLVTSSMHWKRLSSLYIGHSDREQVHQNACKMVPWYHFQLWFQFSTSRVANYSCNQTFTDLNTQGHVQLQIKFRFWFMLFTLTSNWMSMSNSMSNSSPNSNPNPLKFKLRVYWNAFWAQT